MIPPLFDSLLSNFRDNISRTRDSGGLSTMVVQFCFSPVSFCSYKRLVNAEKSYRLSCTFFDSTGPPVLLMIFLWWPCAELIGKVPEKPLNILHQAGSSSKYLSSLHQLTADFLSGTTILASMSQICISQTCD